MLRDEIRVALKDAMLKKEHRRTATIRLISAAIKDRDIAARSKKNFDGITDTEILQMLQTMVKQRHESIEHFEMGGRVEMAEQEKEEIEIIKDFLPKQKSEEETRGIIDAIAEELQATSIKDMGKLMGALREKYAGEIDFKFASQVVKERFQ